MNTSSISNTSNRSKRTTSSNWMTSSISSTKGKYDKIRRVSQTKSIKRCLTKYNRFKPNYQSWVYITKSKKSMNYNSYRLKSNNRLTSKLIPIILLRIIHSISTKTMYKISKIKIQVYRINQI